MKNQNSTSLHILRSFGIVVISLILLAGVGLAGWWAGRTTFESGTPMESTTTAPHTAEAVETSVGQSRMFSVNVFRPQKLLASNFLTGVVTSTSNTAKVRMGDTLYSVANVPVRAISGKIPFYRELAVGAKGVDVAQLNTALQKMGFLKSDEADKFTGRTMLAVRAWQEKLKIPKTGILALGEVVAIPKLPAALKLGEGILKGASLAGGEAAVFGATGEINFRVDLGSDAEEISNNSFLADAEITVSYEKNHWPAVVLDTVSEQTSGKINATLVSPKGGTVCGKDCGVLPPGEQLTLFGEVIVTPKTSGLGVPVTAIRTNESGGAYVRLVDGTQIPVKVLATGQGVSIITGVELGQKVLLDEDNNATAPQNPATIAAGENGVTTENPESEPTPKEVE